MKPTTKDLVYLFSVLFGLGVTWGTLTSRVNAQEKLIEPIPGLITKQAVMDTKLDYLIGLLEYKYGIRKSVPSRPAFQGQ